MNLLDKVNSPAELKILEEKYLPELAAELRAELIETVSKNGGHLASNLGIVETVIALLRVFSPPEDKIVFDVSHQSYAYKILTGRRKKMSTLRKTGGLSGFLKRSESEYDVFGAGHAGTAISSALGFAAARDLSGGTESVVAIVGDGAISNGVSLEALNNITQTTKRFIVVLNDNKMSISRNVGALSKAFGRLMASHRYNKWKAIVEDIGIRYLHMSRFRAFYQKMEMLIKSLFVHNSLPEALGLRYIGPVDGHDIKHLTAAFKIAQQSSIPVLVHVSTTKGKGYPPAEENPVLWHGSDPFDIKTGEPIVTHSGEMTWSDAFGKIMCTEARNNKKIIAITAGMAHGTGLSDFLNRFPDRFYDVGICEGHQMTFAAGLAAGGFRPVVAVYSTFFQRSLDNFIHDAALQKLPVVVCLDRAGAVPGDGPTHHGIFDLAFLRSVPDIVVMQPKTPDDLANMLHTALSLQYPSVIRYPRGAAGKFEQYIPEKLENGSSPLPVGKARVIRGAAGIHTDAPAAYLWSLGPIAVLAEKTAELLKEFMIDTILVDARFAKPIDIELIEKQIADGAAIFVSFEDGVANGGFGSILEDAVGGRTPVLRIGWPEKFISHASSFGDLLKMYGVTPEKIAEKIAETIGIRR